VLRKFLEPAPVRPRTIDPREITYVRSYLMMRLAVGALGIGLPVFLLLFDGVLLGGHPFLRTSLSAYYYSGAREIFVGTLSAMGVFLITYKAAEINLDNTLSWVAGATVIVVALFPTDRSDTVVGLTLLQNQLGESSVGDVHISAAVVFFASLAGMSFLFGLREGERTPGDHLSPKSWRTFHWICTGVIALALVWCLATRNLDFGPSRSLLYGEVVAVAAFGVSWFGKGLELFALRPSS
jgi:uncharacterized protein DUF998